VLPINIYETSKNHLKGGGLISLQKGFEPLYFLVPIYGSYMNGAAQSIQVRTLGFCQSTVQVAIVAWVGPVVVWTCQGAERAKPVLVFRRRIYVSVTAILKTEKTVYQDEDKT
jgi:hypothetical protein